MNACDVYKLRTLWRVCAYWRGHCCLFLLGGLAGTFEKRMSKDKVPRFVFFTIGQVRCRRPNKTLTQ